MAMRQTEIQSFGEPVTECALIPRAMSQVNMVDFVRATDLALQAMN
jgi:hypothetical protein